MFTQKKMIAIKNLYVTITILSTTPTHDNVQFIISTCCSISPATLNAQARLILIGYLCFNHLSAEKTVKVHKMHYNDNGS